MLPRATSNPMASLANTCLADTVVSLILQALNDSMFGNTECYEGEGLEEADDEYAPAHKTRKGDSDSD